MKIYICFFKKKMDKMPYKTDVYHRLQKIHIQIKIEKK